MLGLEFVLLSHEPTLKFFFEGKAIITIGKYEFTPVGLAVILLAATWLIYGAFFAPTGLFTDDEIIYMGMIDRFATAGSFIIPNGYGINHAESLRLVTLRAGPHGLVPQYPSGFGVIAAPFYLLGSLQGIIFMNTLASVLTLWLTYRIARALFDDERMAVNAALIFGLATFAVDYAFAVWPHATSNLFVATSIYAAVLSVKNNSRVWLWGALAGVMIGLGVAIRAEVIMVAPVLFIWVFVNARYPGRALAAFLFALAAGLAVAAWLNYLKFGVFNPLTYGAESEGVSNRTLGGYIIYAPYGLLVAAFAMSLRWRRMQQWVTGNWGWALLVLGVAIAASIPTVREMALRILNGLYALVVDLQHLSFIDTYPRIDHVDNEFYRYYGMLKKSLLESLPWLSLTVFAVVGMFKSRRRSAFALCLLLPLATFMPYAAYEWIGGRANNMRYFSPALPLLAIMASCAWSTFSKGQNVWLYRTALACVLLTTGLLYAFSARSTQLGFADAFFVTGGAQWMALALLLLSVAWIALPKGRHRLQLPLVLAAQMSFLLAFVAAYAADASLTRQVRAAVAQETESFAYIEPNAHVFSPGHFSLYFQLLRPEATLAFYSPRDIAADIEFINIALAQGRPVYIASVDLTRVVRKAFLDMGYNYGPGGFTIKQSISPIDHQYHDLYRLMRSKP